MFLKSSGGIESLNMFSFFNKPLKTLVYFFVNLCIESRRMRKLGLLFLMACIGTSCVKKVPLDPIPELEFKEFRSLPSVKTDSAIFIIGYKDWDGDLFRDSETDGPNIVISSFAFNVDSNKFVKDKAFAYAITQPAQEYYKGKSIQGDIYVPVSEFRSKTSFKKIKFEIFMVDMKKNQSNVLATPQYTFK